MICSDYIITSIRCPWIFYNTLQTCLKFPGHLLQINPMRSILRWASKVFPTVPFGCKGMELLFREANRSPYWRTVYTQLKTKLENGHANDMQLSHTFVFHLLSISTATSQRRSWNTSVVPLKSPSYHRVPEFSRQVGWARRSFEWFWPWSTRPAGFLRACAWSSTQPKKTNPVHFYVI